ncbi:MAG: acyltransferase [Burkholderiales bacterium]
MTAPSSDHRYAALDGLRGFAVLLVFCVHAAGNAVEVSSRLDLDHVHLGDLSEAADLLLFWLWRSHHGVFLFFVLSGFLIGRMWWPDARMSYADFAWRRTLRIYPAFLVSFAASLLFAWRDGTWTPPDWPRVVGNLLFLNGVEGLHVAPFNIVTWSLFYEMTFYLAFPLVVVAMHAARVRHGTGVWAFGVAAPAAAAVLGANPFVLCWSLLFVGVAIAVHEPALVAFSRRLPAVAVAAAYLAVTTFALTSYATPIFTILAFGGAAALVVAKCLATPNGLAAILAATPLRSLGRISYSFYLVHWMVVVLVAREVQARAAGPVTGPVTIFVGGFLLSALVATLLWWLAERPYFALVRTRTGPR